MWPSSAGGVCSGRPRAWEFESFLGTSAKIKKRTLAKPPLRWINKRSENKWCIPTALSVIHLPVDVAYCHRLIIILIQPPDKAAQDVNHCLTKILPFNQLPCMQVVSSHQSAEVQESLREKHWQLHISLLQMQMEALLQIFDTNTRLSTQCSVTRNALTQLIWQNVI